MGQWLNSKLPLVRHPDAVVFTSGARDLARNVWAAAREILRSA